MQVAMFQTPFMPPTRTARQVFRWAVEQAVVCEQAGFSEYWIGEHATQSWESIPNPELVIAAAALNTEKIKLAPGAHLLPYHQPGSLALQIAYLTQILEGRYILGVGAGAYPADGAVRGFKDLSENHRMEIESIEIMRKVWEAKPFRHEGEYWNAGFPEEDPTHPFRDIRPYGGHVEIGVTGLSPRSPSIAFAGTNGFLPLSVYAGDDFLKSHWADYSQAASDAGRTPSRSVHHVVRDVFVADTDAEAKKLAIEGGMGQAWATYLLPVYKRFGIAAGLVKHEGMDPSDIDLEYLAEHVWLVGSPETVTAKLQEFNDGVGGFGTLMPYSYDYIDAPEAWNHSLHLLGTEVAPRITQSY